MHLVFIFSLLFLIGCEGALQFGDSDFVVDRDNQAATDRGNNATMNDDDGTEENNATIQSGLELYTAYCATCHGADAEGTAIWEANIQGYSPIAEIILNGRGDMAPMDLPVADIDAIQEFLLSLAPTNEELDGEGLYTRYCATCHGADASGGPEWDVSLQGYEPIEDIVINGRNTMDPVQISVEDTAKIQAWLLTLAPAISTLNGQQVYERLCQDCHGVQGSGDPDKGYPLRYDDDPYSIFWIRTGRNTTLFDDAMPAYPTDMISDQQLDEMMIYLNSAPKPTTGQGLYDQYCANCHAADGSGGPSRKELAGRGDSSETIRGGEGGNNYANRTSYMTAWNAQQISDAEIDLLNAYIQQL